MDKSSREERKSALKLINKYAQSHNVLEEENKLLKSEISDLKLNLKINKEIIQNFYAKSEFSDFQKFNTIHTQQIEKLTIERDDLRYRVKLIEQMFEESVHTIREENDKLKSKIFVMDNCLLKKDNIIHHLKKKSESRPGAFPDNPFEIYLTDPSQVALKFQDEVTVYKEIYSRLMNNIKDLKKTLCKYEKIIQDLHNENNKLTHEMKYQLNKNYEREREEKSDNSRYATVRQPVVVIPDNNVYNRQYYELEEWWADALKSSHIDEDDFKRFKNNRAYCKIGFLIEFLNNIILDKNFQINMIEKENHILNEKVELVNKENNSLYQQIREFANTKDDSSMHNNVSNNITGYEKKGYEVTMESVNSNEFGNELINVNYFTIETDQQFNNVALV
jgi:hypothetical protein